MPVSTYIRSMPRPASSATPDLFDYVPSAPARRPRQALPGVRAPMPESGRLSDARLVRLLRELTAELQRRKAGCTGRENPPVLDQAIQEAACALESLVARQVGRTRRSKSAEAIPPLQEPKRKAIQGGSSGGGRAQSGREALRPAACRRAQGAHGRRVGQGQAGRPIKTLARRTRPGPRARQGR